MKKLFGIVFLCTLAFTTHVAVKSVYSYSPLPPRQLPCLSHLVSHSATYSRANKMATFKGNGDCRNSNAYESLCEGMRGRYTLFVAIDGVWEILNVRYEGINNPTSCGSLIQLTFNDYPEIYQQYHQINYDLNDYNVCYVWEGWWNDDPSTIIFRDELYVNAGGLW